MNTKIIVLLFFGFNLQAQTVTYFDQDWDVVPKDKATYYRHTYGLNSDSLYHIQNYFMNGNLEMDAYVTTLEYEDNFVGRVNYYYPSGQLRKYITYDSIHLKKQGPAAWYLKNGEIYASGRYEFGSGVEGIVRNSTFGAHFTKVRSDTLVSRLNFYENSKQIAQEVFYHEDNFRYKKEVFYDRNNQIIGQVKYADDGNFVRESGTQIDFYYSDEGNAISVKTILHYINKKAEGKQVSFHPNGEPWLEGIIKNDKYYSGQFLKYKQVETVDNGILQRVDFYNNHDWTLLGSLDYKNGKKWEGIDLNIIIDEEYKKGKRTKRIEYFSPQKKHIKYEKFYGDSISTIQWYDKKDKKIGRGTYDRNGEIINGFDVIYRINSTIYAHYKNGKKDGLLQLFDEKGTLLSEKVYKDNKVLTDKTLNPLTGKMIECHYKNGKAWDGRFFEYNKESIFKDGKLIQENLYEKVKGKWIKIQ